MKLGYTSKEACKVADITYRQLHYWDKTNLVKPSIAAADGTGSKRVYSFIDLVYLRVTAELKTEGISLQKIRRSIAYLSENFPDQSQPLANSVFLTNGANIFVLTENPDVVLDTLRSRRLVLSVAIGHIVQDTRDKIAELEHEEESRGNVFEVVIEPDKDVYLAYCPTLPGCVTWGHTEAEAFHYIRDAVRLHLEDMIADGERIPGVGMVNTIDEVNLVIRVKETRKPKEKSVA